MGFPQGETEGLPPFMASDMSLRLREFLMLGLPLVLVSSSFLRKFPILVLTLEFFW
jgi:hypothetical protein